MKKIRLNRLIYKNFMMGALLPILFIELALIIMYFTINSYIGERVTYAFTEQAKHSIVNAVNKEVEIINNHFLEIERVAIQLQAEHQQFFADMDNEPMPKDDGLLVKADSGALYKLKDNEGSALYYSSDTVITENRLKKAILTERLDVSFRYLVDNNPLIAQVYINTYDNMNRIYPFIDEIYKQYGPTLKMDDYNFYYEADIIHNPMKKPVWTSAYLDPAGMGWMISCVVPVYRGDFLEAVTGIDITVEKLINHILRINLTNESKAFLVDGNGMILAMEEGVEELLDLKELKEHSYVTTIDKTIYKPEKYNLYQHPDTEIRESLTKVFGNDLGAWTMDIKGHRYFVTHEIASQTGWHLFVFTDMDELVMPISDLRKISVKIGMGALVVMVVFYIFFFMFFRKRSENLAEKISKPIVSLAEDTKFVGTEFFAYDYYDSEIIEIQQLNENFEEMTNHLERRTKDLVRAEVDKLETEQEAEKLLIMSMTDPLTKLYNRLKIDEILDYEIEQANRYDKGLSVVMGDIDFFKRVNDEYGHQKGDEVLVMFSELLTKNTRSADTVARWGGEEFIIVFTSTDSDEAFGIAEKLRVMIEQNNFGLSWRLTASFGVTQFIKGEPKESIIRRSDEALYEAKKISRNIVVKK